VGGRAVTDIDDDIEHVEDLDVSFDAEVVSRPRFE